MNPFFIRAVLAADSAPQAATVEQYLHDEGHEVVRVEARGEAVLKAARLLHPDLVVLCGPLRGQLDGVALATALQAGPETPAIPVLLVSDAADLPGLLAMQSPGLPHAQAPDLRPQDTALDAALEETE